MAEFSKKDSFKSKGKWVTTTGWLQKFNGTVKKSQKGLEYCFGQFEVSDLKEVNNDDDNQTQIDIKEVGDSLVAVFWKDYYDEKTFGVIRNFREGQGLTLSGFLSKNVDGDKFFLNVRTFETESELFV